MWVWLLLARGLVAYLVVRFAVQLLGPGRVREANTLDLALVTASTVILGIAALWPAASIASAVILAALWVSLFALERYATVRSVAWRRNNSEEPVVLVYRGKVLEHNLYRKRLSVDQLLSRLRARDAFRLADVELAILEPDGDISIRRNPQAEPLTRQDMLVAGRHHGLELPLVSDGQIVHENLRHRQLSEKWLRDHLRAFNVEFVSEVALATVDENNELYVDKYDDGLLQQRMLHPNLQVEGQASAPRAKTLSEQPISRAEQAMAEKQLQQAMRGSRPDVPKKK